MSKHYTTLMFFIVLSRLIVAQNLEAGLMLGLSTYNGDIHVTPKSFYTTWQPMAGIVVKRALSNELALRGHLLTGKISASEVKDNLEWRRIRGFSFQTKMTDLTIAVEWTAFFGNKTSFYLYAGGGAVLYQPHISYAIPERYIDADIKYQTGSKSSIAPTVVLGSGMKFKLANNINLLVEFASWLTFTDYLDGVAKVTLPLVNDMYFITSIGITKEFDGSKTAFKSNKIKCPSFR